MAVCPNCGNQTGEGAVFCDQCGTKLAAPEAVAPEPAPAPAGGSVICPTCGAGNVPGEAFCDYCGAPLEAPVPTADVAPEVEPVSAEAEPGAKPEVEVEPAAAPVEGEAAPPAEEPTPSPGEGKPICPACGAEVQPGEAFCANCGASLAQPPIPPEPVVEVEPAPVVEEEAIPPALEPTVTVEEEAPPPTPEPVPAVEEVAPPPTPEPVVEEAPVALVCPACGAEIEAGDAFCSSCGASLKAPPPAAAAPPPPTPPSLPSTPAGPCLVVAASGAEIPLPTTDEIVIGREDPVSGIYPEVDLTPHGGEDGGVSRQHARLIVEEGNYFIEDLDSTNFTFVNKQKLTPKTRHGLKDGDEIRCGRVALVLKTG